MKTTGSLIKDSICTVNERLLHRGSLCEVNYCQTQSNESQHFFIMSNISASGRRLREDSSFVRFKRAVGGSRCTSDLGLKVVWELKCGGWGEGQVSWQI